VTTLELGAVQLELVEHARAFAVVPAVGQQDPPTSKRITSKGNIGAFPFLCLQ